VQGELERSLERSELAKGGGSVKTDSARRAWPETGARRRLTSAASRADQLVGQVGQVGQRIVRRRYGGDLSRDRGGRASVAGILQEQIQLAADRGRGEVGLPQAPAGAGFDNAARVAELARKLSKLRTEPRTRNKSRPG
jgi:hypothetical protein